MSNHLGNVLTTISDKTAWNSSLNSFEAKILSVSDYYPFGMIMPGLHFGQPENVAGMEYVHTTEVNGHVVPIDMSLAPRSGSEPVEYVASNNVEVQNGFESGSTDEFTIYIADDSYAGTGNHVGGSGLSATTGKYRYGFNCKENYNEVKGTGNQQDYGERIYDPRLGRFLTVDPLGKQFPELSSYQFASNTPIQAIDLDGLEAAIVSYGYRVTAIIVTGSMSIGAGLDHKGNVKIFYSWSAGLGAGAFAGGGLSASIYPTATMDQVMGGGINVGGNVGIPGVSIGLDINASLQQDGPASLTKKVNDVKWGISGGVKPGSLGPGGVEAHIDYSNTIPIFEFSTANITQEVYDKIKEKVYLTDEQLKNFVNTIVSAEDALKKATPQQQPANQPQQPKNSDNQPTGQQQKQKTTTAPKRESGQQKFTKQTGGEKKNSKSKIHPNSNSK